MDIKAIFQASGKSQSQIASETGVSSGYVSLVLSGQRSVGPDRLKVFADALGVTPADIRPDLASLFGVPTSAGLCEADKSSCLNGKVNSKQKKSRGRQ